MKKSVKIISLILAVCMVIFAFASCGKGGKEEESSSEAASEGVSQSAAALKPIAKENLKIGFITLHDNNSTYDKNFIDSIDEVKKSLGLSDDQVLLRTNVDESDACLTTAEELVDAGCNLIFADSFGHEPYLKQCAEENPTVQFCHASGDLAHTSGLANFHNAFAAIYEGRYLAGVAAGMKLNEMISEGKITADKAKMGYVGAYPYAEVKSGYTSFYLGAKSQCPTVTMEVKFTNSWYDEALEKETANALISDGCVLISQHADSMGAPTACEEAGVPNVSYNGSTIEACPNTFIISSRINWTPYYEYMINCLIKGQAIDTDWTGTISTGSVEITALNDKVAAKGTQEKLDEVKKELEAGTLHVFDTSTFTVDGKALPDGYKADVDYDDKYTPDTAVVSDGYFHESEYRYAPYFFVDIDGIDVPDQA